MIYLLRDDFDGSEELARLKGQFADSSALELNTTVLDGRNLDLDALIQACEAMPFLADRRLVIVRRLLARLQPKSTRQGGQRSSSSNAAVPASSQASPGHGELATGTKGKSAKSALEEQICALLERVPEFVDLVFVEETSIAPSHSVYKSIAKARGKIVQRDKPMKGQELAEWIVQRVRKHGGRIATSAAPELAAAGGEDLRAIDNDLQKLATYADGREISLEDVHALVVGARESNIFAFVDAVGEGNARLALRVLHDLLFDGANPGYLLTMITRQFRLLLQVKDLGPSAESPDKVASSLGLHRFVAQKVLQQSRRFSLERLERAYRSLVETDAAIKTGLMDADTALDLLVVDLSLGRA